MQNGKAALQDRLRATLKHSHHCMFGTAAAVDFLNSRLVHLRNPEPSPPCNLFMAEVGHSATSTSRAPGHCSLQSKPVQL